MKLLRFGDAGKERPGILDEYGDIRDLSQYIIDFDGRGISAENLEKISNIDLSSLPKVQGNPRIGPCVTGTGKYVCIGLNYSDHAAEAGMEVPAEPIIFMKASSAICGPNDDIIIPRGAEKVDWEVELGLVIGKQAKYVSEDEALDYLSGYCVLNDVSEREYQLHRSGQWTKGKSCDTFGPVGPWLVTTDEIPDPQNLNLWLDVNGERMQTGSTNTMVFNVAFIISYLSKFMTLHPGDIIATGTPPGIGNGFKPPRFVKAGDEIQLGIEGLGQQQQTYVNDV
ncbi:MAG: fumarylacetoacetate hydrolase family protein [Pseudomonadales bacterium]|nr:fumarylacetoacetate hydrolase family protein [Pseudomonadales bacterium]